ncbi:MAG TPA: hypothetical protein VH083_24865, partial [Myxococcales bacterium]|nr:hypothetical protein [Myxococcales bacterium]
MPTSIEVTLLVTERTSWGVLASPLQYCSRTSAPCCSTRKLAMLRTRPAASKASSSGVPPEEHAQMRSSRHGALMPHCNAWSEAMDLHRPLQAVDLHHR